MRNIGNRVILQDCDERIGGGAIIGYSFRWSTRNCPSIVADRTAESISIYMDEHKL